MRRTAVVAVFGLAMLVVLALPAMGFAPTGDGVAQVDESDEQAETAPGEQLAGVVAVQGAELDGDLDQRAFDIQLARAADNESRADVVADRLGSVDERLNELRERKATLEERREAGEITQGKYRAEMAKTAAEIRMLSQAVNQSERATAGIPAGLLEERGVDAAAIRNLRENASDLSGPEVADIARDIAGPAVGETPAGDRPGNGTGPPVNATGPPGADDDHPASDRPDGANQSAGPDDRPGGPGNDADDSGRSAGPDDHGANNQTSGPNDDSGNDRDSGPGDNPGNDRAGGPADAGQSADGENADEDDEESNGDGE